MEILRESANSCLTVCLTRHVDQALLSSLLQTEQCVGAGSADRWDEISGLNAS